MLNYNDTLCYDTWLKPLRYALKGYDTHLRCYDTLRYDNCKL